MKLSTNIYVRLTDRDKRALARLARQRSKEAGVTIKPSTLARSLIVEGLGRELPA